MTTEIEPVPDDPEDEVGTDVVATPEGDNEIPPDEPLEPAADAAVSGLETPPGNVADEYKNDKA
jgi:hypothetical protein